MTSENRSNFNTFCLTILTGTFVYYTYLYKTDIKLKKTMLNNYDISQTQDAESMTEGNEENPSRVITIEDCQNNIISDFLIFFQILSFSFVSLSPQIETACEFCITDGNVNFCIVFLESGGSTIFL